MKPSDCGVAVLTGFMLAQCWPSGQAAASAATAADRVLPAGRWYAMRNTCLKSPLLKCCPGAVLVAREHRGPISGRVAGRRARAALQSSRLCRALCDLMVQPTDA